MTSYDPYDAPVRGRSARKVYREVRDDRDSRYADPRDSYLNVHSSRDLVPTRAREDSDLSVEEIRRDFPPPGHARDARRARSAEPGYYDDYYDDRRSYSGRDRDYDRYYERGYDRDYERDDDRRSRKKGSEFYYEEETKKKARMLSKQEQIIAAITGAALAIGGKELYDRREAHGKEVQRNLLSSAALGAAGALAGYQGTEAWNKHKAKEEKRSSYVLHKGRDGKVTEQYYSDEEEDPKEKKGHTNFLEGALAAAGLGGAVKALTGKDSHKDDKWDTRSRSDSRSRAGSRERSRSNGPAGKGTKKIQEAAMASLIAGATEAFRISKQPGSWKGEKAKRVLTAAAGAATLDAAQNPDKGGSKLGIAEAVIGGLVGNRMINGSKKGIEEDPRTGRSRSRSRAPSKSGGGGGGMGGLAALATAGIGAVAGKKILDNVGERSRSRRRSADSYDSRDGSPDRRRRSRSRSVVDRARSGLARLGIGNGPDDDDRDDRSRDRSRDLRRDKDRDDYDDDRRGSRRHRRYDDDDYDDYERDRSRDRSRDRRRDKDRDDYDGDRSTRGGGRDRARNRGSDKRRGHTSDSDLGDSEEDEKQAKKMRGKQILTTGLAAVATIHAAHNVYQSMEKRNSRHKAVKEGRLSPEEAKKLKTKALLQDAASVGIAALGIKGAISEMKEVQEMRHEIKEFKEKKEMRHQKRIERINRLRQITDGREKRQDDSDGDDESEGEAASYYGGRRRTNNWASAAPPRANRYDDGPRYSDGNPYAALPAPPVGYSDRR